jgi:aldose 1-epimerase
VSYEVWNKGSQDMPFGFALHPYFSILSGRDDTLVSIPANTVMEADDELLPTGRLLDVRGIMYAMFDLREPVPVGNLKLDHVYTNLQKNESAVIEYRKQAMKLRVSASEESTHMVIYTPPGEDNPFFCLENQTCSTDAINLHQQGLKEMAHLLELHPGETRTGYIQYAIEHTW